MATEATMTTTNRPQMKGDGAILPSLKNTAPVRDPPMIPMTVEAKMVKAREENRHRGGGGDEESILVQKMNPNALTKRKQETEEEESMGINSVRLGLTKQKVKKIPKREKNRSEQKVPPPPPLKAAMTTNSNSGL